MLRVHQYRRLDFDATDIDKDGKIGGAEVQPRPRDLFISRPSFVYPQLKPMLQLQLEREPTDDEVLTQT